MEQYRPPPVQDTRRYSADTGLEGHFQQMKLQNCVYFSRSGNCAFGAKCRFSHTTTEKIDGSSMQLPERPGQPECQFYMKTGACKFGFTCRFHHPKPKDEVITENGNVELNFQGLPLRPGEKECTYYVETGSCKYGATCKFHHPQPTAAGSYSLPPSSAPYHQHAGSSPPNTSSMYLPNRVVPPSAVPYQGVVPQWSIAHASPNYVSSVMASPPVSTSSTYNQCPATPADVVSPAIPDALSPNVNSLPERPGQLECHHYLKTGDCRFGYNCRYHHPKDRTVSLPAALNPMGLPIRPGKSLCTFYVRHGICKFGPVCKFDHPISALPNNSSMSSWDMSAVHEAAEGEILQALH